jgi:hypothetical protein
MRIAPSGTRSDANTDNGNRESRATRIFMVAISFLQEKQENDLIDEGKFTSRFGFYWLKAP